MSQDRKKIYMWLSVVGVTMIIALIWISSIKYNITTSIISVISLKKSGEESIGSLRNDFANYMSEANQIFNEIPTSTILNNSILNNSTSTM